MRAHDLLQLLSEVRPRGQGRWSALCPAHQDRNPSLSVREGEKAILVRCFAGCELPAICQALGIQERDLFFNEQVDPAELEQQRIKREQARLEREREHEAEGLHLDQLREAEHLLRVAKGIRIDEFSDDQLNGYLQSIADAHDLLRKEMGEEDYAEFCLSLG